MNFTNRIVTVYYDSKKSKRVLKTNYAKHARSAILRAVDHMQMNDYSAFVAVIHDEGTSELYAIITRSVTGEIRIVFRRDPSNPTCLTDIKDI